MSIESRGGNGDHGAADIDGDLEFTCRGNVRIARIGGNVRLDVGRSELIRASDVKGRVDVQFQLEATVERGDALNNYGAPIQKEMDGRRAILKGSTGDGPMIRLTARRAYVAVRKDGTLPSEILPDVPKDRTPKKLTP